MAAKKKQATREPVRLRCWMEAVVDNSLVLACQLAQGGFLEDAAAQVDLTRDRAYEIEDGDVRQRVFALCDALAAALAEIILHDLDERKGSVV